MQDEIFVVDSEAAGRAHVQALLVHFANLNNNYVTIFIKEYLKYFLLQSWCSSLAPTLFFKANWEIQ